MNWRLKIIRSGSALSFLAWCFGAILLGLGNAFISPVETGVSQLDHGLVATTADVQAAFNTHSRNFKHKRPQHAHDTSAESDATRMRHLASVPKELHHDTSSPLPAHCLFCLDGLSPLSIPPLDPYSAPAFAAAGNLRLATLSREFSYTALTPPVRAPPVVQFS